MTCICDAQNTRQPHHETCPEWCPSDSLPRIYGENANSLAVMFEYIQQPEHPFYRQAKEQVDRFLDEHRKEQIEAGKRIMQQTRANMTDAEWSAVVD